MALMPRESGELIAKLSKNVFIQEEGVKKLAEVILDGLKNDRIHTNTYYQHEFHPTPDHPQAVDWIFVQDLLNFCFWPSKGTKKWQVDKLGGYFSMCKAIKRAMDEGKPIIDPAYYSKITRSELEHILRGDDPTVKIPLLDERLKNLWEAGKILLTKYKGSFVECVKSCEGSAEKLLKLIVDEFESFQDEADYRGHRVGIYKRAQILIADIWACFQGKGIGHFYDIDYITMFADYRVPQVLLHFGALRYSDSLSNMLEHDLELENGAEEEVEIRGCSIECTERVKKVVKDLLKQQPDEKTKESDINSITVDFILWDYRWQHASELDKSPFHKTRCIYY